MRVRSVLITAVAVASLVIGSGAASADPRARSAPPPTSTPAVLDSSVVAPAKAEVDPGLAAELERLAPFFSQTKAGVTFDAKAAVAAGHSRQYVDQVSEGIRFVSTYRDPQASTTRVAAADGIQAASCVGRVKFTSHWWGYELWMNSCDARGLVALLAGGAALASVAAGILTLTGLGIPWAAAVAIGAAAIALGAAAVQYCSRYNRGLILRKGGLPPCQNQ